WREQQISGARVSLSVKLSSRQFGQPDLVEAIADALREEALAPSQLSLEITESTLMEQPQWAGEKLNPRPQLGVGLELDAFGTGYSSLSYLQRFPIDRIKIDRSFVQGMDSSKGDLEIVRAVLSLGHNLGMTVIAEGIETPEHLQRLRLLNCEYGQGFFFA